MNRETLIVNRNADRPMSVLGVDVDVYLDTDATDGQYTTYRCVVPPNVGPPPHWHDFDEAFFILEGTFEILSGEETREVGPGTYVYVPRGTLHTFRNSGESTATFLGTATPAGHEAFFREADALTLKGPMTVEEVVALCGRHGIEIALSTHP